MSNTRAFARLTATTKAITPSRAPPDHLPHLGASSALLQTVEVREQQHEVEVDGDRILVEELEGVIPGVLVGLQVQGQGLREEGGDQEG